jgi:putative Holliday junction resolvase
MAGAEFLLLLCRVPRILAIDYGRKRSGIAVTDDLQMIASGLTTVQSHHLLEWLKDYFARHEVIALVVGDPVNLRGEASESAPFVQAFITSFERRFPAIPVVRIDERFTSKMAFQTMIDSGLRQKARRNKALIDEISATILLQSYLELKDRTR